MAGLSAEPTTHAVRFADVAKQFGDRVVLTDLDLAVRAGEVLALMGPSGGGKSTILRLINGLEVRDAGALDVLGTAIPLPVDGGDGEAALWRPLRARIGFVFQAFHLYPHLRAFENVALAPHRVQGVPKDEAEARARVLLEQVGLTPWADAKPRTLSGGQQQRVAIARALAMEPEILLFDEPTSALDPSMSGEVLAVMRELAESGGRTLVVVTHEVAFARDVADRVAYLEAGAIVEIGTPDAVIDSSTDPRTRAFFRP